MKYRIVSSKVTNPEFCIIVTFVIDQNYQFHDGNKQQCKTKSLSWSCVKEDVIDGLANRLTIEQLIENAWKQFIYQSCDHIVSTYCLTGDNLIENMVLDVKNFIEASVRLMSK